MYTPTNSPFGDAYRAFIADAKSIDTHDTRTLDELASCADMLCDTPVYADDVTLRVFRDMCRDHIIARASINR